MCSRQTNHMQRQRGQKKKLQEHLPRFVVNPSIARLLPPSQLICLYRPLRLISILPLISRYLSGARV